MDPTSALLLFAFFGYFVVAPAATYFKYEREHRLRWRRRWRVRLPESDPGGPFREPDGVEHDYTIERRGAPRLVKVVSVVSLVLGHMFLPGLLAGLFGLVFYGLGVVSIPGLWLAASIYRNAFGLLRCDPKAAQEARRLREFSLGLNALVLLVAAMLLPGGDLLPLLVFTVVYAFVSIAHAEGLARAADAIDAVHRREAPRVEPPVAARMRRAAA